MKDNRIVVIGRQFGSGGREIAKKLAAKLAVKCYDKELLTIAAKNSGLCDTWFEVNDEKPNKSFLYSLVLGSYSMGAPGLNGGEHPLTFQVHLAQQKAICEIAERESCVIVGRCADYALRDYPRMISVFISANVEDRVARVMEGSQVDEAKARDLVNKNDKSRASYYNYYSEGKWGDAKNYDLCINVSKLGIDKAVEMIEQFILLQDGR